jgi:uncharacterized protein (TIGR02145 family)
MKSKLGWNNWIYKWGFKLPVVTVPVMTNVKYGYLYNWYAVSDSRNMANTGWHVATQAEYNTLITYLGGGTVSGAKLRETGLAFWTTPNTGATNEVGFNLRGFGCRQVNGAFSDLGISAELWINETDGDNGYVLSYITNTSIDSGISTQPVNYGLGVRLVNNDTLLADGDQGIYIGNDGTVYRTICIGTQEWIADNLAETKYRNGDTIPTVTDNAAWNALTTGAKCAYNNDESNVLN